MKTFEFFWNYFKVYKISFVVVIAMIIIATVAQALFQYLQVKQSQN